LISPTTRRCARERVERAMRAAVVGTRARQKVMNARRHGREPGVVSCEPIMRMLVSPKKSGNLLLTLKTHGCMNESSRHHARAPRAVRPTPVRLRPQDLLEPATAKRSQAYGSLGDNHVQVKRRTRCVRVDHPESAGFSRREAR
jgi:hypothetical protein